MTRISNAAIRPDRDHYFGRIWRVQHKEAKKLDLPKLDSGKPAVLIKALEHPNEWVRMTALRLLLERNKTDVVPQLEKLALSRQGILGGSHSCALAFERSTSTVAQVPTSVLISAIGSPDAGVSKNALEIAGASSRYRVGNGTADSRRRN